MYLTCNIDNASNTFTLTGSYWDIDDPVDVNETGTLAGMGTVCRHYHEQGCFIWTTYTGRTTKTRMHFGFNAGAECA